MLLQFALFSATIHNRDLTRADILAWKIWILYYVTFQDPCTQRNMQNFVTILRRETQFTHTNL